MKRSDSESTGSLLFPLVGLMQTVLTTTDDQYYTVAGGISQAFTMLIYKTLALFLLLGLQEASLLGSIYQRLPNRRGP